MAAFNIAFFAPTKAAAKTELSDRNDQQEAPMSDAFKAAIGDLIDALGDREGNPAYGIGIYGEADSLNVTLRRVPAE